MGSANPPPRTEDDPLRCLIGPDNERAAEIEALREENADLRELVIQLSKLVIRKVVDSN
jgi:hypothetical protein